MEPEQGDHLEYDGHNLILCDEEGFIKDMWTATSGLPRSKPQDQGRPNYGPLPQGEYVVNPRKIDYLDESDHWSPGDWGESRVPIIATPETKKEQLEKEIDRGGFFVHGGKKPGSLGCLDLGQDEERFFDTLEQYNWELELEVDYGL